jgi:hypothetical protein
LLAGGPGHENGMVSVISAHRISPIVSVRHHAPRAPARVRLSRCA